MPPAPRTSPTFMALGAYWYGRPSNRGPVGLTRVPPEARQGGPHRLSFRTLDLRRSAAVAELVDARRSGRRVPWDVEVRLLSAASRRAVGGSGAPGFPR